MAVCGSVEERHGIVLSANPIAKWFQVKTAMAVWQAQKACPHLVILPPDMPKYHRASSFARDIYGRYSDRVQPYGLDECWSEVTGLVRSVEEGREIADQIRYLVKREIGITVSVGVSFNKVFAKLGSDIGAPDTTTVITEENYKEVVWPLPAKELLFVGRSRSKTLADRGIRTIGQLANANPDHLKRMLGVWGVELWQYANGIDNSLVLKVEEYAADKSVGNSYTPPRDLITEDDVRTQVMVLAESVSERMRAKEIKGYVIKVHIRYSDLFGFDRQKTLAYPIRSAKYITDAAMDLIRKNWKQEQPIREVGVSMGNLIWAEAVQTSLLPEIQAEQKQDIIEAAVQGLRDWYGHFCVQRGLLLADRPLSHIDLRDEHSTQTLAFYRGAS